MFEQAESVIFSPQIEKLEEQLQEANQQMEVLAKKGKYVLAENIRQNAEKIKADLEAKRKDTLGKRHREEAKEVKRHLRDDLDVFHKEWDCIIKENQQKGDKLKKSLKEKQQKECECEKERLEHQISEIGKESSELLNLRKIEENLAKQHNFLEAHLVQKQIKELAQKEELGWYRDKQGKIETELATLKARQQTEMKVLLKKIKSEAGELELERTKAEAQLTLMHSVMRKGLLSQNRKENLMASGELRSKVDVVSPGRSVISPSKSRILLSSSSWKLLPTMTR